MGLLFIHFVGGYQNILLIGPKQQTYLLAKHYSRFYNIPLIETGYFYPKRYIMISEEYKNITHDDTLQIEFKDYPHKDKNPNYFISWLKQSV